MKDEKKLHSLIKPLCRRTMAIRQRFVYDANS